MTIVLALILSRMRDGQVWSLRPATATTPVWSWQSFCRTPVAGHCARACPPQPLLADLYSWKAGSCCRRRCWCWRHCRCCRSRGAGADPVVGARPASVLVAAFLNNQFTVVLTLALWRANGLSDLSSPPPTAINPRSCWSCSCRVRLFGQYARGWLSLRQHWASGIASKGVLRRLEGGGDCRFPSCRQHRVTVPAAAPQGRFVASGTGVSLPSGAKRCCCGCSRASVRGEGGWWTYYLRVWELLASWACPQATPLCTLRVFFKRRV